MPSAASWKLLSIDRGNKPLATIPKAGRMPTPQNWQHACGALHPTPLRVWLHKQRLPPQPAIISALALRARVCVAPGFNLGILAFLNTLVANNIIHNLRQAAANFSFAPATSFSNGNNVNFTLDFYSNRRPSHLGSFSRFLTQPAPRR